MRSSVIKMAPAVYMAKIICPKCKHRFDSKRKKHPPPPEFPWSWHKSLGWRGQFNRIRRWHDRLAAIREIREAEDYLYTFFQNSYHLRDWLLHEKAVPQVDIEELFRKHVELRLCGDLCNATKHLALSAPKQPREFSLAREYCGPRLGWFGSEQSEAFVVMSDGQTYNALDLAGACLGIWEDFLRSHHLQYDDDAA
jgi:hypothetical protein